MMTTLDQALAGLQIIVPLEQPHIDHGVRFKSARCPLALALSQALDVNNGTTAGPHVSVGKFVASIVTYGSDAAVYNADLPVAAVVFVSNFDASLPALPFSFPLRFAKTGEQPDP